MQTCHEAKKEQIFIEPPYYTILYSTLLYSTLLYATLLYYTILCYTIPSPEPKLAEIREVHQLRFGKVLFNFLTFRVLLCKALALSLGVAAGLPLGSSAQLWEVAPF